MTDPCTRRSLAASIRACGLALAISSTIAPAANAQCEGWLSGFGIPGIEGSVGSLSSHDDGHGPALYLGGNFRIAGDITASRIVRWDGASWSRLDAGLEFAPRALAWFDDGSGTALYAGGSGPSFTQGRLARWNGTSWSELGPFDGPVHALQIHDDGSGPALFVGGSFTHAGGVAANYVARWDGTSWAPLGAGMNAAVGAFAIFDDGSGPALHAGGFFTTAGGIPAKGVARWTGASWSPLGPGATDQVRCLAAFDDGSGPALFVGEHYANAAGGSGKLEKWNGASWSSVASFGAASSTSSLAVHDDGSGKALYVGGFFGGVLDAATATTVPAQGIARWDGTSWSGLADGLSGSVLALAVHDDGSGPALFAGGGFTMTGNRTAPGVARWSSSAWSALDARNDGFGPGPSPFGARVTALYAFDDGSGPALYAGGNFSGAGHVAASRIARWDGSEWSAVGPASSNSFSSFASFDDGGGPVLYAGGSFPVPGAPSASGLARWDGVSWSVTGGALPADVSSLCASTSAFGGLFVGGGFTIPGVTGARRIARWSGTSWSSLASGIDNGVNYASRVETIAEWSTGGPSLAVAGRFDAASGVAARNIALWNGTSWSALGAGVDQRVRALAVFDDGQGPALYAGGEFLQAGGVPASRIARWDGTSWSPVAGGVDGTVRALYVHDDGQGRALYAAGDFHAAGGAPARRIARFDGTSWSALGHGLSGNQYPSPGEVDALAAFDDGLGGGAKLCAGGTFTLADDKPSARFAIWSGCASPAPLSFCTGDEDELACPCSNPGSPGHGCANGSHASGAKLSIHEARSGDALEVEVEVDHLPPATIAVLMTSTSARAPVAFGRGLSCTGAALRRKVVPTSSGAFSVRFSDLTSGEAALRDPVPGGALVFQVVYRDRATLACPAPSGTWNATNAVELRR